MSKPLQQKTLFEVFAITLLVLWLCFFLFKQIDLTTADLGRHLKNGELILQGEFDVLKSNFYSYTQADYPFVNHHWLSGVIFFLIFKISGFAGLHFFGVFLTIITFIVCFYLAKKSGGSGIAIFASLLVIPLIAQRREVRPETLSCFFAALFFLILYRRKQSKNHLFFLPLIQILWVNSHIYFFLGPLIMVAFLIEDIVFSVRNKQELDKKLFAVFFLVLFSTLLNPFGLKGALHPLSVYGNYGYRILEEQSVIFLQGLGFIKNPNFLLFKAVFSLLILSFALALIKNRSAISLANFFLACGISLMAWVAIRNFTLFGFFCLPIISANLRNIFPRKKIDKEALLILSFLIFVFTLFSHYENLPVAGNAFGLGLMQEVNKSAEFFEEQGIQGPIFNNYDIGGYLIFHLFPEHKVFVDNRPETYPASFFQDIYIPLQQDEELWREKSEEYMFNTIFFYRRDATPWAQPFLIERIKDPAWIPVFVDNYAIILLKNNDMNREIIKKYELPVETFKISQIP